MFRFIALIFFSLLPSLVVNAMDVQVTYNPLAMPSGLHSCYGDYESRIRTPGKLSIAVVFGYSDTIDQGYDLVTDQWVLARMTRQLTDPCQYTGQGFCAFNLEAGEPHQVQHYSRQIQGPDNQDITVDLYTINSSFDISNYDNQTKYKTEQATKSETAQRLFAWALQTADVVFYEGHSRNGGGPDFLPPRAAVNGKVNYPWYEKNQPGLKFLLEKLEQASRPPMILGLFSCASQKHFYKKLAPYTKNTNTILSTRVVEAHYTKEALLLSLESLLNFECSQYLHKRLEKSSFIVNRSF